MHIATLPEEHAVAYGGRAHLNRSKSKHAGIARKRMAQKLTFLTLILAGAALLASCNASKDSDLAPSGFSAEVSGATMSRVTGPGLIRFVPASSANVGLRSGYFFVADDSGVRELGITFTLPANAQPGTYELVSATPMDIGTSFAVRVDWSQGNRTESFQLETEGTITLKAFPKDGDLVGQSVVGSFEFSTQDRTGQQIRSKGSFDFDAR